MEQDTASGTIFQVTIFSFGYKYGFPDRGNCILDVRCLPNPYWQEELRDLTGLEPAIAEYVLNSPKGADFAGLALSLLQFLLKQNKENGKSEFICGIGCTGGHHRSVAVAEFLGHQLQKNGYLVTITHRDISKE